MFQAERRGEVLAFPFYPLCGSKPAGRFQKPGVECGIDIRPAMIPRLLLGWFLIACLPGSCCCLFLGFVAVERDLVKMWVCW